MVITLQQTSKMKLAVGAFNTLGSFDRQRLIFMLSFAFIIGKGWVEVMMMTMQQTTTTAAAGAAATYFVLYHLCVSLVVLSLFVAVILDNLELDEDIKQLKQIKMREQVAQTHQKLPLRLRIFEKFADQPQV